MEFTVEGKIKNVDPLEPAFPAGSKGESLGD